MAGDLKVSYHVTIHSSMVVAAAAVLCLATPWQSAIDRMRIVERRGLHVIVGTIVHYAGQHIIALYEFNTADSCT